MAGSGGGMGPGTGAASGTDGASSTDEASSTGKGVGPGEGSDEGSGMRPGARAGAEPGQATAAPAAEAGGSELAAFRESIPYYPADLARAMASLVALGAEVFMLRAEVEAMRRAAEQDPAHAERLRTVRDSDDFGQWLEREERAFARGMLGPLDGDGRTSAAMD